MLEPVQNCFTFYHPDGISSAQEYSEQDDLHSMPEKRPDPTSIIAQQDLPLTTSTTPKNS